MTMIINTFSIIKFYSHTLCTFEFEIFNVCNNNNVRFIK